jgi:hypothetical protein
MLNRLFKQTLADFTTAYPSPAGFAVRANLKKEIEL